MSDIFISYSSDERQRVLPLVNALEKTGWSVFWDRTIPAGKAWRQVIGTEIRTCRSVVVVWTASSIRSEWVLEEAETGKRREILIPVLLDEVEPPFGFGTIQAANLTTWDGEYASPAFTRFIGDISAILGPIPTAVKEAEEHRRAEDEASRNKGTDRFRPEQPRPSAEEAGRKANEKNPEIIENDPHRGWVLARQQTRFQGEQTGTVYSKASRYAPWVVSLLKHFTRSRLARLKRFALGTFIVGVPVLALWFIDLSATKNADVEQMVSLKVDGETLLNRGEHTASQGETSPEDTKGDGTKNVRQEDRNESLAAASEDSQTGGPKSESTEMTAASTTTASPRPTSVAKQATPFSEPVTTTVTGSRGLSQSTAGETSPKRGEETKRKAEQQRRQTTISAVAKKAEESKRPINGGATLRSAEAAGRVVNLRNVITTAAGKVSGEVVNSSNQTLRDVRLQILYSWRWKDEHRPGTDDPGKAIYHVLGQEIPPSETVRFAYEPSPPFAARDDGQFDIGVKIVGFTEVFQESASR
jgi:hypothetical protein